MMHEMKYPKHLSHDLHLFMGKCFASKDNSLVSSGFLDLNSWHGVTKKKIGCNIAVMIENVSIILEI